MGMAFTDALIDHADVHVTLVDRRHAAGGHWHDAYPFVQLHQASLFYGVASTVLGTGAVQQQRPRVRAAAAGPAVGDPGVLRRRPAPPLPRLGSGHVPRRQRAPHRRRRLTSSRRWCRARPVRVDVRRRVVDATYLSPTIPATTPPPFGVADGVRVVADQRAGRPGRGAEPLRDRRFGQDRHRRDRVAAGATASTPTGSCGSGPAIRGCSTVRSSSRTRSSPSGLAADTMAAAADVDVARRPVPPPRGRRGDAPHRPGRRCRRWPGRRRSARGSSTCCARSSTSCAWGTSSTWSRGEIVLDGGVVPLDAGRARRALRRQRPAAPADGAHLGHRTGSGSRPSAPGSRASAPRWPATSRPPATTTASATASARRTRYPNSPRRVGADAGSGARPPRRRSAPSPTSPPGPTAAPSTPPASTRHDDDDPDVQAARDRLALHAPAGVARLTELAGT